MAEFPHQKRVCPVSAVANGRFLKETVSCCPDRRTISRVRRTDGSASRGNHREGGCTQESTIVRCSSLARFSGLAGCRCYVFSEEELDEEAIRRSPGPDS